MTASPLVSIAVTTRNSALTLAACLESIRLQSYGPIELIVVDNYSVDATFEIAQSFADHVCLGGPERASQRNQALLTIASGEIFGYVDSDMILGPGVVQAATDVLVGGAVGAYVPEVVLKQGWLGEVRRFERSAYNGSVVDAARFFWRETFIQCGGFDSESFGPGPEDWDLDLKLQKMGEVALPRPSDPVLGEWPLAPYVSARGPLSARPDVIYHDESTTSLGYYLWKKSYYGDALARYRRKWSGCERVRQQFSLAHRLVFIFVRQGQWKRTLRRPDLFIATVGLKVSAAVAASMGVLTSRGFGSRSNISVDPYSA